jgi:hypothetical protein
VDRDIFRQDSAHRRHSSAQRRITSSSAMASQLFAHASHTSAQTPHVRAWNWDPRSMKSALVVQIWAQSSNVRMCEASACFPPFSRQ